MGVRKNTREASRCGSWQRYADARLDHRIAIAASPDFWVDLDLIQRNRRSLDQAARRRRWKLRIRIQRNHELDGSRERSLHQNLWVRTLHKEGV